MRSRPHLTKEVRQGMLNKGCCSSEDDMASSCFKSAYRSLASGHFACCRRERVLIIQKCSHGLSHKDLLPPAYTITSPASFRRYVYVMVWPALHVNVSGFTQFFNRLTASDPKRTVSGVSVSKLNTQERPVSAACSGRLKLQVMKWEWPNTPHTTFSPFFVRKVLLQSFRGRILLLFFCRNCIYCLFLKALLIMCLK